MLKITFPSTELYDEEKNEFIVSNEQVIQLEHSLVSLSKWEGKWQKPFMSKEEKTREETVDYIRCMTITQNVDPNLYYCLTPELVKTINDYIASPMTATTITNRENNNRNREQITAELIYYWMVSFNIPMECQKWHLNRLLTLIEVCNIKNQTPKNMPRKEAMSRNRAMNMARRNKYKTNG